jgi:hypothetical protein
MELNEVFMLVEIIILFATAVFTAYTYFRNKREVLKSRAMMLVYQIKDIQKNIQYIKENCYKNNIVWVGEFHKSDLIYSKNLWEENKIYIANKLSVDSYEKIEKLYNIANVLLNEQIIVKKAFDNLIETKGKVYYESQLQMNIVAVQHGKTLGLPEEEIKNNVAENKIILNEGVNLVVDDYIPNIYNEIIHKCLQDYQEITDGVAYEQIKKIAGIRI